jgi:hypothetical protein
MIMASSVGALFVCDDPGHPGRAGFQNGVELPGGKAHRTL